MWYKLIQIKQSGTKLTAQVTTDSSSPWFAGHFPGTPILPGVAQLGMVADLISKFSQDVYISGLSRIKFKKLIKPGELLSIHISPGRKRNSRSFRIEAGEEVCTGIITLENKEKQRL
ncbi:MAG TPA: hypothetical protein ENK33_02990 [Desulfobacterales bacterium]|nr:hypothetical protein [Desulfobacterales bacterium]